MPDDDPLHARARERLIFALDIDSASEAKALVRRIGPHVGMFKVGKQLFVSAGPSIVKYINDRGGRVFLDLKFHDIPATTGLACIEATRLGAALVNVHAGGGSAMMRQAASAVRKFSRAEKIARPRLLGVTVLTSLSNQALGEVGVRDTAARQAVKLAKLARGSGLDGVVASPREIAPLRKACGSRFLIVTPGIRSVADSMGDQRRVSSAGDAMYMGANYIVVGRPIRDARDPADAADRIVEDMCDGLRARRRKSPR